VDRMTMKVGDRIIQGEIKERGEARAIYEQAKAAGKVASLLDQERPNIFTQSVANIEPGEQVDISISYSETLDWKDGEYQFDFPMVVGPRYIPGGGSAPAPMTTGQPTAEVPDADRITPPVTPEGTRAGHDISITVNLNAGFPLRRIDSKQHAVEVDYPQADKTRAVIKLKQQQTIPNKDFVLVYETAADEIQDALLAHTDQRGKFFTLVLQPPKRVRSQLIVPKEIVFVIDNSGSMSGFPIETAKQAMRLCIEGLHPNDTLNLITFSGNVSFCFEKPVPNTDENRRKALDFLGVLWGSGGTEMMKAINACLAGQDDPERVRVVCFMTDGYVGNDLAIIDAVKRNAGVARVFSFGIGRSVNRYLLDGMAQAGRGEVHYILDQPQATGAAERFYERVRTPVLTDVELDFGGLTVEGLYPARVPDLFSSTPVVVKGRYKQGGKGTITLRGKTGEGKFERKIDVTLPEEEAKNEVLASLWARAKVGDLMQQDLAGIQRGQPNPAMKEEILGLGLRYQLLTQFTSFVAVEHLRITEGNTVRTVPVPVEMPEGVSYEGVFGPGGGRPMAGAGYSSMSLARAGRGPAAPARAPLMRSEAAPAGRSDVAAGKAQLRESQTDALAKQLEAMDKEGKSDVEKKPVVEQLLKIKLADELQGLAEKVAKQGTDGNLTVGKISVKAGRVEIRVQVAALSDEVLAKLKTLGFRELARAKSVNLLIGTIDVKQLEALAKLAEVHRIEPSA
jgi:Ca-activated chloride channel family protein